MLNQEEKKFIEYWKVQRLKKKQFFRKFSLGLPLGVAIMLALVLSMLSGWYEKADEFIKENASVIIVVLIACLAIVAFISLFSVRHQWDQNEQHYHELLAREEKEKAADALKS